MGNAKAKLESHPDNPALKIDRGDGYYFIFDKVTDSPTAYYQGGCYCCCKMGGKDPAIELGEKVPQLSCKLSEISKIHLSMHTSTNSSIGDSGRVHSSTTSCWCVYLDLKDDGSNKKKEIRLTDNRSTNALAPVLGPPKWFNPFIESLEIFLGIETIREMTAGDQLREAYEMQQRMHKEK